MTMENTKETKPEKKPNANAQIARATGVVMFGFVLSNLVGLIRGRLIANVFGTEGLIDAYYLAERLPNILFMLVAGGALGSAFIPTFTGLLERGDRKGAWKLASAILNLVFILLFIISILAIIFADPIVNLITHSEFPVELLPLMVDLLRILLITTTIFGVSGLLMGIHNAYQSFVYPALAPTLYWLGLIFGVVVLAPTMGVYGLAWGTVLGAFLHLIIQIPALLKLPDFQYRLILGLKIPAVREVGRLMAPRILGVSVVQINSLVNVYMASGMVEGSIAAIVFAFQVMTMPQVVIAQAISIAALPTFSAQIARGKPEEMRASLASVLRSMLYLSLPATLGLVLLRQPIIAMLFKTGEFDARSVELTAWALLWYSVGLVSHSLVEILSRAFYAMHDTKTPVLIGTINMSLNIVFSLIFPGWFASIGWLALGGLALANTAATSLEAVALVIIMRKRLKGLEGRSAILGVGKSIFATLAMSGAIIWWLNQSGGYSVWVIGLVGICLGGLVYGAIMVVLKVPELQSLIRAISSKLKSMLNR